MLGRVSALAGASRDLSNFVCIAIPDGFRHAMSRVYQYPVCVCVWPLLAEVCKVSLSGIEWVPLQQKQE